MCIVISFNFERFYISPSKYGSDIVKHFYLFTEKIYTNNFIKWEQKLNKQIQKYVSLLRINSLTISYELIYKTQHFFNLKESKK